MPLFSPTVPPHSQTQLNLTPGDLLDVIDEDFLIKFLELEWSKLILWPWLSSREAAAQYQWRTALVDDQTPTDWWLHSYNSSAPWTSLLCCNNTIVHYKSITSLYHQYCSRVCLGLLEYVDLSISNILRKVTWFSEIFWNIKTSKKENYWLIHINSNGVSASQMDFSLHFQFFQLNIWGWRYLWFLPFSSWI